MRGLPVPLDAADFQDLLVSKFSERDGMYFLPEQVGEYDEKKLTCRSLNKWRTPDIHEAKDREAMRNRILLREFNGYLELARNPKGKRLKDVRVEALLAGFKHCWTNKDFVTMELIINEIDEVPEPLLIEVLDFVHFLKAKIVQEKMDIALMSESSLSKDWLKPEEEEAWQNFKRGCRCHSIPVF
jgi:hypothetical protein